MKKNWRSSLAIAAVCALLAFGLTWQMRSVRAGNAVGSTAKARADQLQTQLTVEQEKNEALYNQILEYKDDLQAYADQAETSGGYTKVLAQQLEQSMLLSGQSAVEGPGVTVVLQDSQLPNTIGIDENNYVIHDEDLLKVVNELRDAGAEALSLNGERLLATSEIRCAGSIVSVNNNRYAAPFTICAIGNADDLASALTMRQGVVDSLAIWGIECVVTKSQHLSIAGYNGGLNFKYAKLVKTSAQSDDAESKGASGE